MLDLFVDYATIISYIAFSTDILFQIFKVSKRKSSLDVSWKGAVVRTIGSSVLFIKFFTLQDTPLIIGQAIFLSVVIIYLVLVLYYRHPKK